MSNVLKIFVVLNFILAIVFVATAATLLGKADDWKGQHDALAKKMKDTVKEKDGQIGELTSTLDQSNTAVGKVTNERDDFQAALGAEQNQKEIKSRENDQLRASVDKLESNFGTLTKTMKDAQTNRDTYEKRATTAEEKARDAVAAKETAEDEARRLTAQLEQRDEQVAQYEADLTTARADLEKSNNLVKIAIDRGFDLSAAMNAPAIDAVVQRVNDELRFVMLSVGREDKVTKGMKFQVSRGGNYIGEVLVDSVYPNLSAARITMTNPGAKFQAGDTASTRL